MTPLLFHAAAAARRWCQRHGFDVVKYPNLRDMLRRCDLLIDCGANRGQSYDFFRSHGYVGQVLSIEADRESYALLADRTPQEKWCRVNVCLGEVRAWTRFYLREREDRTSNGVSPAGNDAAFTIMESHRLDTFAFDATWPGVRNIFLKIDCEGHDLAVLRGAWGILPRVKYLMIEVPIAKGGVWPCDFAEAIAEIKSLGFSLLCPLGGFWGRDRMEYGPMDLIFVKR